VLTRHMDTERRARWTDGQTDWVITIYHPKGYTEKGLNKVQCSEKYSGK